MSTCLQDKTVKTRKEHRCSGCYKVFPKGRKLHYQSGVCDGDFYSVYICNPCRDEYHRSDYSDGYSEGDLREGRRERVRDWQYDRNKKVSESA
jgi:hypothetical protein